MKEFTGSYTEVNPLVGTVKRATFQVSEDLTGLVGKTMNKQS